MWLQLSLYQTALETLSIYSKRRCQGADSKGTHRAARLSQLTTQASVSVHLWAALYTGHSCTQLYISVCTAHLYTHWYTLVHILCIHLYTSVHIHTHPNTCADICKHLYTFLPMCNCAHNCTHFYSIVPSECNIVHTCQH